MSDTAPITLSARNLTRRFGQREVICGISLELRRGEVLGLLGHNGAGKSTILQMLSGALLPHSGQIEICGYDLARQPKEAKARIGFLPEMPPLYREMRVDDYLNYAARLHRTPRAQIAHALAETKRRCGLHDCGRKIIGTLSKGYQQRVGIAQAIIHNPEVIILDEPTVGLDPSQIRTCSSKSPKTNKPMNNLQPADQASSPLCKRGVRGDFSPATSWPETNPPQSPFYKGGSCSWRELPENGQEATNQ